MNNQLSDPLSVFSGEQKILFVFGAARSGTTYLGRILEDIFDFGMGPEGHFVFEFAEKLSQYGDLQKTVNIKNLIADVSQSGMLKIMREKWRNQIRTNITEDMIWNALPERSYAGVVYAVFYCVASEQGRQRVGNKNPGYWKYLDQIESMFPGKAQYLCIVRDGRDVAISNMKMNWGQDNVLSCAKTWKECVHITSEFAKKIGTDRFLDIRYEDLLNQPECVIDQLATFLHAQPLLNFKDKLKGDFRTSVKQDNHGKWVTELTHDEQRIYESIAGKYLRCHGYNTVFQAPLISLRENVELNVREVWRKIRFNISQI